MNKTSYEILGSNQVKIIEEITTSKETVVDIGAVQKRVEEITSQIIELQGELNKWNQLLDSTKNTVIVDELVDGAKVLTVDAVTPI